MYTNSSKEYLKNKRLFYRLLLKSFVKRHKEYLEDVKKNRGESYLSVAQATSILSWWKKIGKHLDSNISIEMIELDVSTELAIIEAIVRLSVRADLTDSMENWQNTRRRKSSLTDTDTLISQPGIELSIDSDSLDIALEKACKRAIWSTGFNIVDENLPNEYLAKLTQMVAAQYIHKGESEKELFGRSLEEAGNYLQNIDKEELTKTILAALSKTIESPSSPEMALAAAIDFVGQETGDKIGESILITEMDTAFQNLLFYASKTMGGDFDLVESNLSLDTPSMFSNACNKHTEWILEPLALVCKLSNYKVYIPFRINPADVMTSASLGTKPISGIPSSFRNNPSMKLTLDWMSSAIEVNVLASSHKQAYKKALEKIAILLDGMALLHPNGYVNYQYNKYIYASECNGDVRVGNFTPKGYIPRVHGESHSIIKNVDSILELRKSEYNWVKQLARCSRLIRKAAEAQDQETRFLHLWRALEAICGHLTGLHPDSDKKLNLLQRFFGKFLKYNANSTTPESRQMSPRNFLVLAVSLASGKIVSMDEKNFWSEFDKQYTYLWRNLSGIMRARSQWVIHTGDERENSIEEITEEYLESACNYMINIIYPAYRYLGALAIENPNLQSREQVYNEVFLGSIAND